MAMPMSAHQPHRRAVLVDLDGTLVDSAPDLAVAANRMLAQLGAAPLPLATVRGFIGKGVANLVRQALAASGTLTQVAEAHALALFERHYTECNGRHSARYPGVLEGLSALAWLGYPLACVTNKPRTYTMALLDAMGLSACFGVVVCGDAGTALKPDPAPLLRACHQLGVQPALGIMVGDSEADAIAANRAGMPVYLVRYGYHGAAGLAALRCDGLIDSMTELPALLSSVERGAARGRDLSGTPACGKLA
jgi:phosphoglycolate phosphatase